MEIEAKERVKSVEIEAKERVRSVEIEAKERVKSVEGLERMKCPECGVGFWFYRYGVQVYTGFIWCRPTSICIRRRSLLLT